MAAAAALTARAAGFILFLGRFVLSFSHFGFPVESVRMGAPRRSLSSGSADIAARPADLVFLIYGDGAALFQDRGNLRKTPR